MQGKVGEGERLEVVTIELEVVVMVVVVMIWCDLLGHRD